MCVTGTNYLIAFAQTHKLVVSWERKTNTLATSTCTFIRSLIQWEIGFTSSTKCPQYVVLLGWHSSFLVVISTKLLSNSIQTLALLRPGWRANGVMARSDNGTMVPDTQFQLEFNLTTMSKGKALKHWVLTMCTICLEHFSTLILIGKQDGH